MLIQCTRYWFTLTDDQQEGGRKALVSITLSMKEHEERNLRADEVDESQSFKAGFHWA